ncbi:PPE family protein [Mycolicibacterium sp. S2-37]|uniref:PPE family protein n=1 Tax=Mycolicibacterium sp. S2-37 TaxID=2810297 RepID=UPI001A9521FC|nr:PPE family protein [Mycolicibacterium sp. S2-37]MBO0679986.1 PPE family protein [Mycolicibacterium sp. S2-37]
MPVSGIPLPPTWVAMPPEVNTARLMAGAGPAPMLQAAAGWEGFALLLETQADELAASLSNLASLWSGTASERAIQATMPTIMWLRTTAAQAMKRALQATNQANSYTLAMATTPPLPEIEQNHITHGVLEATNFLGINTVPIGLNEFDYFVRMWNQAAGAMDVYQAETQMNSLFEPILPLKPIVIPGIGESGASAQAALAAARAPMGAARNAVIAKVSAQGKLESAKLGAGRAMAVGHKAGEQAQSTAQKSEDGASQLMGSSQQLQQGMQMGVQMATQVGSTVAQIPQQMGQMVQTPMQMLTQPLQQMSSVFGQMGGLGERNAQMGLIGASPLSNHPLAGGSGASSGSGLVRAASLPGAGGTSARTPLMSNLVGKDLDMTPVPVGAGVGPGVVSAGLAPVGGSGVGGGMGPMMGGQQAAKSGGSKTGLTAPAPLAHDLNEDEGDDW